MRHYFKNDSRPKSVAKAIRTELAKHGHEISHSDSLRMSARVYSYRNWSDLLANLGNHPPSPDDLEAGETVAEARFTHHVQTLVDCGIDRDAATSVIRKIGPTSSGARQRRGREELWCDDAAVANYLNDLAVHLAADAVEVVPEQYGTWLGFTARFGERAVPESPSLRDIRMHHGGKILFGVSYDGRSAILRKGGDTSFKSAIDERIGDRRAGTPDDWDFLDECSGDFDVPSMVPDGAKIISEVFSRLHVPSMRAMRSAGIIRENKYEKAVASDRMRNFLLRYPSLADHCFWSFELPKEIKHRGSSKWIEGSDADVALMAILTEGNLPSGEALAKTKLVAEALQDYAITSNGNDVFSANALKALVHLGPDAIPTSKAEMKHLIRSAEEVASVADYGMTAARAYDGFRGSWKVFHQAILGNEASSSGLYLWSDSFAYLICSAFGQTYGVDPQALYDRNFSNAITNRLGPTMMSRLSMTDIAALQKVIRSHSAELAYNEEERWPTVTEADELAALFALPMPEAYHGKSCLEILAIAGYELDTLAGMLKLEPDLTFDEMGLPVIEQRFAGLDPTTYAVKPLERPTYEEPRRKLPRRPLPMPPQTVPDAPSGWVFQDGEYKSTDMYRPSRIRWSDGANELNGSGPGWYADRGFGRTPHGAESRCPVRLGRFETPADAADAINNARGYR